MLRPAHPGRLDQAAVSIHALEKNPLAKYNASVADVYADLARRFFRWIGPATPGEFQWTSGLGVKAAKAAIEPLRLVTMEDSSDRLMLAEDGDALLAFKSPKSPQYSLVSSLDAIRLLRRDTTLGQPADLPRPRDSRSRAAWWDCGNSHARQRAG